MKDADFAVKMILDEMLGTLERGDRTEIRGFGSFDLNYRPPRIGRNPRSGEKMKVAAKYVPHFKAGKELRERVDQDHYAIVVFPSSISAFFHSYRMGFPLLRRRRSYFSSEQINCHKNGGDQYGWGQVDRYANSNRYGLNLFL